MTNTSKHNIQYILLALILITSSCNMFSLRLEEKQPLERGSLELSWPLTRTALPDLAANIASITVTISSTDLGIEPYSRNLDLESGSSLLFDELLPGVFLVEADFYNKDSTAVGSASDSVTIGAGKTSILELSALYNSANTGNGHISLSISWPAEVGAASLSWAVSTDISMDAATLAAGSLSTLEDIRTLNNFTMAATAIASGSYYLQLRFFDAENNSIGSFLDSINVYGGMTTTLWLDSEGNLVDSWNLTEENFYNQDQSFTAIQFLYDGIVEIPAKTPSSSPVDLGPIAVNDGIYFYVTFPSDGRSLQYQWNGPYPWETLVSGEISSKKYIYGVDESLIVRITAPSGEYTDYHYSFSKGIEVEFDPSGGSWAGEDPSALYKAGSSMLLPLEGSVTRGGYKLLGWSSDGTSYNPGSSYTAATAATFSAIWGRKVTCYNGSTEYQTDYYLPGTTVTLDDLEPGLNPGKTFAGWDTSPAADTTVYHKAESGANSFTIADAPVDLYAVWVEGSPIRTVNELRALCNEDTKWSGSFTFTLTNDLDLEGEILAPIGESSSKPFKGTFRGGGHILSNLAIEATGSYHGLFGYIDNGKISSLTLAGASLTVNNNPGYEYLGLLAGYVSSGTISNCFVSGTISAEGCSNIGGMAGYLEKGLIENSQVVMDSMTVGKLDASFGGLVGLCYSASVNRCSVFGEIVSNVTSTDKGTGGLIGYTSGECLISNSSFRGTIKTKQNNTGGILGYAYYDAPNKTSIENCTFSGTLTPNSGNPFPNNQGGIVGYSKYANIKSCSVIDSFITVYGSSQGGIAGVSDHSSIEGCSIANSEIYGSSSIGGIVGASSSDTISYCQVSDITIIGNDYSGYGTDSLGGVVGSSLGDDIINNCSVTGSSSISGTNSNHVGGLAGLIEGFNLIEKCFVKTDGEISGNNNVGGFIGLFVLPNGSPATITNSFADTTNLSASLNSAGFIGNFLNGNNDITSIPIKSCYAHYQNQIGNPMESGFLNFNGGAYTIKTSYSKETGSVDHNLPLVNNSSKINTDTAHGSEYFGKYSIPSDFFALERAQWDVDSQGPVYINKGYTYLTCFYDGTTYPVIQQP